MYTALTLAVIACVAGRSLVVALVPLYREARLERRLADADHEFAQRMAWVTRTHFPAMCRLSDHRLDD